MSGWPTTELHLTPTTFDNPWVDGLQLSYISHRLHSTTHDWCPTTELHLTPTTFDNPWVDGLQLSYISHRLHSTTHEWMPYHWATSHTELHLTLTIFDNPEWMAYHWVTSHIYHIQQPMSGWPTTELHLTSTMFDNPWVDGLPLSYISYLPHSTTHEWMPYHWATSHTDHVQQPMSGCPTTKLCLTPTTFDNPWVDALPLSYVSHRPHSTTHKWMAYHWATSHTDHVWQPMSGCPTTELRLTLTTFHNPWVDALYHWATSHTDHVRQPMSGCPTTELHLTLTTFDNPWVDALPLSYVSHWPRSTTHEWMPYHWAMSHTDHVRQPMSGCPTTELHLTPTTFDNPWVDGLPLSYISHRPHSTTHDWMPYHWAISHTDHVWQPMSGCPTTELHLTPTTFNNPWVDALPLSYISHRPCLTTHEWMPYHWAISHTDHVRQPMSGWPTTELHLTLTTFDNPWVDALLLSYVSHWPCSTTHEWMPYHWATSHTDHVWQPMSGCPTTELHLTLTMFDNPWVDALPLSYISHWPRLTTHEWMAYHWATSHIYHIQQPMSGCPTIELHLISTTFNNPWVDALPLSYVSHLPRSTTHEWMPYHWATSHTDHIRQPISGWPTTELHLTLTTFDNQWVDALPLSYVSHRPHSTTHKWMAYHWATSHTDHVWQPMSGCPTTELRLTLTTFHNPWVDALPLSYISHWPRSTTHEWMPYHWATSHTDHVWQPMSGCPTTELHLTPTTFDNPWVDGLPLSYISHQPHSTTHDWMPYHWAISHTDHVWQTMSGCPTTELHLTPTMFDNPWVDGLPLSYISHWPRSTTHEWMPYYWAISHTDHVRQPMSGCPTTDNPWVDALLLSYVSHWPCSTTHEWMPYHWATSHTDHVWQPMSGCPTTELHLTLTMFDNPWVDALSLSYVSHWRRLTTNEWMPYHWATSHTNHVQQPMSGCPTTELHLTPTMFDNPWVNGLPLSYISHWPRSTTHEWMPYYWAISHTDHVRQPMSGCPTTDNPWVDALLLSYVSHWPCSTTHEWMPYHWATSHTDHVWQPMSGWPTTELRLTPTTFDNPWVDALPLSYVSHWPLSTTHEWMPYHWATFHTDHFPQPMSGCPTSELRLTLTMIQ